MARTGLIALQIVAWAACATSSPDTPPTEPAADTSAPTPVDPLAGAPPMPEGAAAAPLAEARRLMARGEAAAALPHLEAADRAAPGSPIVSVDRAIALTMLNRPQDALEALRGASPDDPRAAVARSNAQLLAGERHEALATATAATERWPGMPDGWYAAGRAAIALGFREEAEAAMRDAIGLAPAELAFRKGLLYVLSAWPDDPEYPDLEADLLAEAPGDPDVVATAAMARHASGKIAEAETLYRRALALDPNHADANINLATLLAQRQGLQAARPYYERWLAHAPRWDKRKIEAIRKMLKGP